MLFSVSHVRAAHISPTLSGVSINLRRASTPLTVRPPFSEQSQGRGRVLSYDSADATREREWERHGCPVSHTRKFRMTVKSWQIDEWARPETSSRSNMLGRRTCA